MPWLMKIELQSSLHADVQAGLQTNYGEFVNSDLYKPGNSARGSHMALGSLGATFLPVLFRTNNDAVSAQMTPTGINLVF